MSNEKKQNSFFGGDDRLVRGTAGTMRDDREDADEDRINDEGTSQTVQERRAALRKEWALEILPQPPQIPNFHTIWLSSTNQQDPIYKRVQLGYILVKASEVKGFDSLKIVSGEYEGGVACNEMILFKIPQERYIDLMSIFHHDMPLEEEEMLRNNLVKEDEDRSGKRLGIIEGKGFEKLGNSRKPRFS